MNSNIFDLYSTKTQKFSSMKKHVVNRL